MSIKGIITTGIMLFLMLFVAPLQVVADPQKQVDLNQADLTELQTLPGIGSTTAKRIVEYREENGRFERIEEIMNVWGIGEKKFERFKDLITVAPPVPEKTEPLKEEPAKEDPQ